MKQAIFLEKFAVCVPQAKKIVVGKTPGAPKNVNLILWVKALNSPNGGGPHITPKTLRPDFHVLISGVVL
jgi:hypothetical protein